MRHRQPDPEPETRTGNCCGCNRHPLQLFKVANIFRYRCEECFEKETGYRHHLMPAKPRSVLVLP